ncbi:hypothetical protein EIP86_008368 [Pleurotus ostreatoroseus]|nr:hypothetical protein EIP86_008368 [Pleurotus ostreatoroseus]
MGKKATLKSALSSQQFRLKRKQEAKHAAQVADQKSKKPGQPANLKGKGKGKATARPGPPPVIPFKATDRILLIGEGNLSFARALVYDPPAALQYLPLSNLTATAYDTEEDCLLKYPEAREILQSLREKNVEVLFGVDATKLERHATLKNRSFDKIVWNFPHAGKGIADQDRNILSNQLLLLGFLRSAAHLLKTGPVPRVQSRKKKASSNDDENDDAEESADEENGADVAQCRGSILITLRNVPPYTLWDLPKLAKSPPPPRNSSEPTNPRYIQLRSFVFLRSLWKGYEHRMTKGERVHGKGTTGIGGEDRTWEFCLGD